MAEKYTAYNKTLSPSEIEECILFKAVWLGRLKLTRLLVEGGEGVNSQTSKGQTPLMLCILTPYRDSQSADKELVLLYLLESGSCPNMQDNEGKTALIHAFENQAQKTIISLLIEFGADPSLKQNSGKSPITDAAAAGDEETLKLFNKPCDKRAKYIVAIEKRYTKYQYEDNHTVSFPDSNKNSSVPQVIAYRERMRSRKTGTIVASATLSPTITTRKVYSKPAPHERKLLRRRTADEFLDRTKVERNSFGNESKQTIDLRDWELVKSDLLKWEKDLNTYMDSNLKDRDIKTDKVDNLDLSRLEQSLNVCAAKMTSSKPILATLSESDPNPEVYRVKGPHGQVLQRQGSGTKLIDDITRTRPGVLPPLNINPNKPIPGILHK